MLVVDASQSLGAAPFALAEIRPDFLVAAAYKWLLCPYGFAVLYVSEQWRDARPLEENWLAREHAEDFANLVRYSDAYMPGSRRFDGGQKCSSTILPGAIAALEQIAQLSPTPALRREQIKLQVALIAPLIHVKGYAARETTAAANQTQLRSAERQR